MWLACRSIYIRPRPCYLATLKTWLWFTDHKWLNNVVVLRTAKHSTITTNHKDCVSPQRKWSVNTLVYTIIPIFLIYENMKFSLLTFTSCKGPSVVFYVCKQKLFLFSCQRKWCNDAEWMLWRFSFKTRLTLLKQRRGDVRTCYRY